MHHAGSNKQVHCSFMLLCRGEWSAFNKDGERYWSISVDSNLIDGKSFAGRQVAFLQSSSKSIQSFSKHLKSSLLLILLATRPVVDLLRLRG